MSQHRFSPAVLVLSTALSLGGFGAATRDAYGAVGSAVSIGDVTVAIDAGIAGKAAIELGLALRAALSEELNRVTDLRSRRPLIVSATLTRVSSERSSERAKASVAISLALVRADDQVLFAELRGRASVEEASGNLPSLRSAALRGAVQRALARLPEAVQRSG